MTDEKKSGLYGEGGRAEDFLQVFKRGVQFTEELLAENERLRFRVVRLEEENRSLANKLKSSGSYEDLMDQMKALEGERAGLIERYQQVEEESLEFKRRYQEIEEENNRLANLYIASFQLHSTLDINEVVRITFEIIINLVGSMDFALYIADEEERLIPVRTQGCQLESLSIVKIGEGIIGKAAQERTLVVSEKQMNDSSIDQPKVCVPLLVEGNLLGVIVVFGFLEQKLNITELDSELFRLLGGHAAMALYSARLKADSKNTTLDAKSFMDLLDA